MNNIVWVKVKFCRNLNNVMFGTKIKPDSQKNVLKIGLEALADCGLKGEELNKLSDSVIESLISNEKMEHAFVERTSNRGFASNEEVGVQVNGDNHFEIIASDVNLSSAYSNAKKIDKMLCNKLHFAYSDKYGFLSADIKNVGSGMQISALMLLPALHKLNLVKDIPMSCDKLGFKIQTLDEHSGACVISIGANLGYTEKDICELTNQYLDKLIKCEIEASKQLAKDEIEVLDLSLRAKAIINSCLKIDQQELYGLVGDILIAINSGLEKNITDEQINKIFKNIQNNNEINLAKSIKNILNN